MFQKYYFQADFQINIYEYTYIFYFVKMKKNVSTLKKHIDIPDKLKFSLFRKLNIFVEYANLTRQKKSLNRSFNLNLDSHKKVFITQCKNAV